MTEEEVRLARSALHDQILRQTGVSHETYLADANSLLSTTGKRMKGPASGVKYAAWKMFGVHLHPRVIDTYVRALSSTYGSYDPSHNDNETNELFAHPFGPFDSALPIPYVDRVCYRLPGEGGLGMHLDRNPFDPYQVREGGLKKWRPIQSFVCLTDHFGVQDGGLKVLPGFHKDINAYFRNRSSNADVTDSSGGGGEFFLFKDRSHASLERRLETVIAPAGSMVLWDNRLPHATSAYLDSGDTREVVYAQFLPDVHLNRLYAREQWRDLVASSTSASASVSRDKSDTRDIACDRDWCVDDDCKSARNHHRIRLLMM